MSEATLYIGDVFEVMAGLPDGSVDQVLTSPPFLALRSYLPAGHPLKHLEIGSEPTPAEFLDTLLALTAEWGRLLAPHGSLCVELGDTYAGSGGGTRPARVTPDLRRGGTAATYAMTDGEVIVGGGPGWPLDKSLCIIPELYAACLAYGRNVLTGEESPAGQWRVRNLVRWVRPNPPVGALGDKFRPATSVMTVACKARDRWFDLDDVRTEGRQDVGSFPGRESYPKERGPRRDGVAAISGTNPAGAPPLDWWNIPTEPYSGSHYATWPRKLCERPIRSMCPREVCRVCGEPRRRVVEKSPEYAAARDNLPPTGRDTYQQAIRPSSGWTSNQDGTLAVASYVTLGWTDCGHDDYRRGIVLDPFAGSGTTLAVATGLGRDAWGIDLDARNAELARERVGMFLTVVELFGESP